MGLRQTIEENSVVFFLGALITGFIAGWAAYGGVQSASGLSAVPADKAKLLNGDTVERLQQAESDRAKLQKQLLQNRPTGGTYVSNIVLSPRSPGVLASEEHVVVDFDYVVAQGQKASIYAEPNGTANGGYQPSPHLEGSGHTSRYVLLNGPGKMQSISIRMLAEDGQSLYEMSVPVDFTYQ